MESTVVEPQELTGTILWRLIIELYRCCQLTQLGPFNSRSVFGANWKVKNFPEVGAP